MSRITYKHSQITKIPNTIGGNVHSHDHRVVMMKKDPNNLQSPAYCPPNSQYSRQQTTILMTIMSQIYTVVVRISMGAIREYLKSVITMKIMMSI
jgi:hypothetical protein